MCGPAEDVRRRGILCAPLGKDLVALPFTVFLPVTETLPHQRVHFLVAALLFYDPVDVLVAQLLHALLLQGAFLIYTSSVGASAGELSRNPAWSALGRAAARLLETRPSQRSGPKIRKSTAIIVPLESTENNPFGFAEKSRQGPCCRMRAAGCLGASRFDIVMLAAGSFWRGIRSRNVCETRT